MQPSQASCLASLWDHQVQGTAIFPAAAYLEMATAALRQLVDSTGQPVGVHRGAIPAPLYLPAHGDRSREPVSIFYSCSVANGELTITSMADPSSLSRNFQASAKLVLAQESEAGLPVQTIFNASSSALR